MATMPPTAERFRSILKRQQALVGADTHPGAGLPGVIGTAEVLAQLVPDPPDRGLAPARAPERMAAG